MTREIFKGTAVIFFLSPISAFAHGIIDASADKCFGLEIQWGTDRNEYGDESFTYTQGLQTYKMQVVLRPNEQLYLGVRRHGYIWPVFSGDYQVDRITGTITFAKQIAISEVNGSRSFLESGIIQEGQIWAQVVPAENSSGNINTFPPVSEKTAVLLKILKDKNDRLKGGLKGNYIFYEDTVNARLVVHLVHTSDSEELFVNGQDAAVVREELLGYGVMEVEKLGPTF